MEFLGKLIGPLMGLLGGLMSSPLGIIAGVVIILLLGLIGYKVFRRQQYKSAWIKSEKKDMELAEKIIDYLNDRKKMDQDIKNTIKAWKARQK